MKRAAFAARYMEPPVRPGRDRPSSAGIFTNAHIGTIHDGTFVNVAHIYESDSPPAQGGGPAFPVAVLSLQAVSFATRSHYPHCDHLSSYSLPLLIPESMGSTSSLVLYLPSLHQDMRTVIGPVALWLLIKMLVTHWQRRSI